MLCAGKGCDHATAATCCVAWGKFRKLQPILTTRHLSPMVRNKVYTAGVHSPMLHGSEIWELNASDLQLLRDDCSMICWICGTKDQDETSSASLLQKLSIEDMVAQIVWTCTVCYVLYQIWQRLEDSRYQRVSTTQKIMVQMWEEWCQEKMWPGWLWSARQKCMEGLCSVLPSAANPLI